MQDFTVLDLLSLLHERGFLILTADFTPVKSHRLQDKQDVYLKAE